MAPGETKAEAAKRRAVQAEKRRLAAQRAEEDRANKARKRRSVEDDGEDDEEEVVTKVKKAKTTPRKTAASSRPKRSTSSRKPTPAASAKPDPKEEQEEMETESEPEEPKPKKPSAREKRAAAAKSTKATPAARKSQTSKHGIKKTPSKAAATPPRRGVTASGKAPFGSPPPSSHKSRRGDPPPADDPPLESNVAAAVGAAVAAVAANNDATIRSTTMTHSSSRVSDSNGAPVVIQSQRPGPPAAAESAIPLPSRNTLSDFNFDDDDDDFDDEDDDFDFDDDDEDDEDENSLRQQALRVIAERRDREYVARMQAQAAAIALEQRQLEEKKRESEMKRRRWTWPLMGVMTTVFLAYYISRKFPDGLNLMHIVFPHLAPVKNVCFYDSPGIEDDFTSDEKCQPKEATEERGPVLVTWKECPEGAVCQDGLLQKCPPLLQIHDDYCYLSTKSNATLKDIKELLHVWTVQSYCGGSDEANHAIATWADRPFFHYSRVVGELEANYDPKLIVLGNQTRAKKNGPENLPLFILEQEGNDLWLGLHPKAPFKLHFTCRVARGIMKVVYLITYILNVVFIFTWDLTKQLSVFYYQAFKEAPGYVSAATLFSILLFQALKRRYRQNVQRAEKNAEIVAVREDVQQQLEEAAAHAENGNASDLSLTWLCEKIAWKRHQMSKKGRVNMVRNVWPCVVQDIEEDSRIQTIVRTENSVRVKYWKWVAPVSAKYRNNGRFVRFDQ